MSTRPMTVNDNMQTNTMTREREIGNRTTTQAFETTSAQPHPMDKEARGNKHAIHDRKGGTRKRYTTVCVDRPPIRWDECHGSICEIAVVRST